MKMVRRFLPRYFQRKQPFYPSLFALMEEQTSVVKVLGIIPARYGSTRFPAKALADIAGKPMVQWVYENALKARGLTDLYVATDHPLIADVVTGFGGKVVMTQEAHPSGTDRCWEAYLKTGIRTDYVVNIQGDEPFVDPRQIEQLIGILDGETQLGTLVKEIHDPELLFSANTAKVVVNLWDEAIYFSRHPIPFVRSLPESRWASEHSFLKHIGIYAYRTDILQEITQLAPGLLEKAESLEQLRWIENGFKIRVARTTYESLSVDTPDDLAHLIQSLKAGKLKDTAASLPQVS